MSLKVDDFIAKNKDLDEATFLAKYPHPFLVSEGSSPGSTNTDVGGTTGKHDPKRIAAETKPKGGAAEGPFLIPVRRRTGSQHGTIVTVGRGEDCDLRITQPLVSKRHAYFTQDGEGWAIADAESSNGTYADGTLLEPHKKHPLADSEALRFGPEARYRFFGALSFFRYMTYRSRMKGKK